MTRPTAQTLDPLGGLTARYFLIATVVLAGGTAALLVARHWGDISRPLVQGAALLVLAIGITEAALGADPRFFPFGARRHALLQATILGAALLDSLSRAPGIPQDAVWGPTVVALCYVMSGSFRPPREVLLFSLVSAVGVGLITALQFGDLAPALAAERILRAIVPVVAVGAGAAAFSAVLIARLTAWHALTGTVPDSARTAAASAVQRSRLDFVDYRVGPFLESLLESDSLTPVDAARARGLAAALRHQMVRDAARSWFSEIVEEIDGDPAELDSLDADQRRALGAIVAELRSAGGPDSAPVHATILAGPPRELHLEASVGRGRIRVPAYRAVLGASFPRARVDRTGGIVTIALQVDR